jgi:Helicase conserved C-terminal domain/PLD-like domain/SNF2-related domain
VKPEFLVNHGVSGRVADAINSHLKFLRETQVEAPALCISTAYFNVGGFALLADELERTGPVRLLLGAEPHSQDISLRHLSREVSPARASQVMLRMALSEHGTEVNIDRDLLGFTVEADKAARRLIRWLESGSVEVRRLETSFLHGKAFIVSTYDEAVIAGSSNFTYAGLATNIELNLGHYQPSVVQLVKKWFDELWDQSVPFDLRKVYADRFEPYSPYVIYIRMLFERYGKEMLTDPDTRGGSTIHLTSFQQDGLWRAARTLKDLHGVLIADEVGLGKTFIAGELMRQAVEERRQRVLLVASAAMRDGPWRKFLQKFQLGVEAISFEQLASDNRLNPDGAGVTAVALSFRPQDYAMVVVDEAHNLRNPTTQRAIALRTLLSGSPPKDLVLITATPVNNSLWDLYYLLSFFIKNDGMFVGAGIKSIRDHFATAMALNPDDLSPAHLFEILDATAVRRTRHFVKSFYANDTIMVDGVLTPIVFPEPRVRKLDYNLDDLIPGFFQRFEEALEGPATGSAAANPDILTLARYMPSRYKADEQADPYEVQLAGLLRSGMLKRFESSAYAFSMTCRKMAANHDAFLELLSRGKVTTGAALSEWIATDSDDIEVVAEFLDRNAASLDDIAAYDGGALRRDVEQDKALLLEFAELAESVAAERDPKLRALVEELARIVQEAQGEASSDADFRNKRKVIVFSYFADTVEWIGGFLERTVARDTRLEPYRNRIVTLTGSKGKAEDVLWGFAPKSTEAPDGRDADLFDVLIATDLIAEGVNLQQARYIINYDLPWNPMRLVQRHGRIDRIGSFHRQVFMVCFFPDRQLDTLLGLEDRLQRKIKQAAASMGLGSEVLPGSRVEEVVFSEAREQIEKLRSEDPSILERGGSSSAALSGEEYRQELRKAFEVQWLRRQVEALPWAAGSGFNANDAASGYVFCARVGDYPQVQFRFVRLEDSAQPTVIEDTLACLARARPPGGMDWQRDLSEEQRMRAYWAWTLARDSIVTSWNRRSDPANLAPEIPAAMNRAADIVRKHHGSILNIEDADRLVDALQAPYPERIVRQIRLAMASSDDAAEQVKEICKVANELGLEPAPAPVPLPEITESDVHPICWIAVV